MTTKPKRPRPPSAKEALKRRPVGELQFSLLVAPPDAEGDTPQQIDVDLRGMSLSERELARAALAKTVQPPEMTTVLLIHAWVTWRRTHPTSSLQVWMDDITYGEILDGLNVEPGHTAWTPRRRVSTRKREASPRPALGGAAQVPRPRSVAGRELDTRRGPRDRGVGPGDGTAVARCGGQTLRRWVGGESCSDHRHPLRRQRLHQGVQGRRGRRRRARRQDTAARSHARVDLCGQEGHRLRPGRRQGSVGGRCRAGDPRPGARQRDRRDGRSDRLDRGLDHQDPAGQGCGRHRAAAGAGHPGRCDQGRRRGTGPDGSRDGHRPSEGHPVGAGGDGDRQGPLGQHDRVW